MACVEISPAPSNVNARAVGKGIVVSWTSMNVWTNPVAMEEDVKISQAPSNVIAQIRDMLVNCAVKVYKCPLRPIEHFVLIQPLLSRAETTGKIVL